MSDELVYGASRYGYTTIAPRVALERVAAQVHAALAAATYGEARAVDAPIDNDEIADDAAYDVRELGQVADGDWPPNAGMVALETLPSELVALMHLEHSMVGQEWAELRDEDVARVVEEARSMGYVVRRDDELICSFDSLLEL
ncbi:hypothetical protein [Arthrobacter sp. NEB 688]|uniref:hypothetical protein n=1 Tax=Arthrobacter sp. NEB 688 TaxID=904039 RepID=UPI0015670F42|nr:hypothetical protein [Arthrobacter sp. NEB 688]QKE84401.1 hypothetical protein HL663_10950 [Arthrobacter sp. NEB 688]